MCDTTDRVVRFASGCVTPTDNMESTTGTLSTSDVGGKEGGGEGEGSGSGQGENSSEGSSESEEVLR